MVLQVVLNVGKPKHQDPYFLTSHTGKQKLNNIKMCESNLLHQLTLICLFKYQLPGSLACYVHGPHFVGAAWPPEEVRVDK